MSLDIQMYDNLMKLGTVLNKFVHNFADYEVYLFIWCGIILFLIINMF